MSAVIWVQDRCEWVCACVCERAIVWVSVCVCVMYVGLSCLVSSDFNCFHFLLVAPYTWGVSTCMYFIFIKNLYSALSSVFMLEVRPLWTLHILWNIYIKRVYNHWFVSSLTSWQTWRQEAETQDIKSQVQPDPLFMAWQFAQMEDCEPMKLNEIERQTLKRQYCSWILTSCWRCSNPK